MNSRYATVADFPLPALGGFFYSLLLVVALVAIAVRGSSLRRRLLQIAFLLTVVGLTFSLGLMAVQFGILRAFCPLCTLSATVVAALVFTTGRAGRTANLEEWGGAPAVALSLGMFAIFPAAILLYSSFVAPPIGVRIDLSTAQLAGSRDAPVQLVVFSDFECQFCRQLAPVVTRIQEEFPREVAVAFRHFPLPNHPRAERAAIAAECAAEQGAFWQYHDRLFSDGGDLSDATLLAAAVSVGIDRARFEECLKSERPKLRVESSRTDAIDRGLQGAPAVFLNGRQLRGRLDYETLVRQVRAAVERERRPASKGGVSK